MTPNALCLCGVAGGPAHGKRLLGSGPLGFYFSDQFRCRKAANLVFWHDAIHAHARNVDVISPWEVEHLWLYGTLKLLSAWLSAAEYLDGGSDIVDG